MTTIEQAQAKMRQAERDGNATHTSFWRGAIFGYLSKTIEVEKENQK